MKAFGIIAEYNPFHEGHKYLIDTASALTKADVCISVISGDFVQRGGYAYFDKWDRAQKAVKNGVDLVVEMPQVYAFGSAGYFARAGVKILEDLSCDYLVFGSECGDIEKLNRIADCLAELESDKPYEPNEGQVEESENSRRLHKEDLIHEGLNQEGLNQEEKKLFGSTLKEKLSEGLSYPAAREMALRLAFPDLDLEPLQGSNDVLALEYLKNKGVSMEAVAIKRIGDDYGASASKIRAELILDEVEGPRLKAMGQKYFDLIRLAILSKSEDELNAFDSTDEGLGNKLKKEIRYASDLNDLIERSKSKRYTYTRISRLLAHILLGTDDSYYREDVVRYIRPLAMTEKGAAYLREIKKSSENVLFLDDIAKSIRYPRDEEVKRILEKDILAADIYSVITGGNLYSGSDFVRKPIML